MNYNLYKTWLVFSLIFFTINTVFAQSTESFTTPGTITWNVPAGVTSVTVQVWGAGGGGATTNKSAGGGGGGYASSVISVTPLSNITIVVGQGGGPGVNGQNSSFNGSAVVGAGGSAATSGTAAGSGGSANIGTITFNGGNGDVGGGNDGGGGGASASAAGVGGNASARIGGTAPSGGGAGGNGGIANNSNGSSGSAPGGGGGGEAGPGVGGTSGSGGNGQVVLTYSSCSPNIGVPVFALGSSSSRTQGAGDVTYSATSTNATGITYSLDASSLAAGNTINSATGQVTYVSSWFGNSTITASASGCGGPLTASHTANTYNPAGKDGPFMVTASNTLLNRYTRVTTDILAGSNTITVSDINELNRDGIGYLPSGLVTSSSSFATNIISKGDLIMLYQAQGAIINATNTINYGSVSNVNGAGNFEFAYVESVSGNTITLTCNANLSYFAARYVQVIRVPQFTTLTVNSGASIVAVEWGDPEFGGADPSAIQRRRGGIVAILAENIVNNGIIHANAAGFRGGTIENLTSTFGNPFYTSFRNSNPELGAEKGESIAGYRDDYDNAYNGRYGRGAPANGGGGGNAHNAGGGGGANGGILANWFRGAGVMNDFGGTCGNPGAWALDPEYIANGNTLTNSSGGGKGGYSFSFSNQNACVLGPSYPANFISAGVPATDVLNTAWAGDLRDAVGGLGGRPLVVANPQAQAFFGGGGGAGDGNNDANADGGDGGGLVVLLVTNDITGSGTIQANGQNGFNTVSLHNDAPGGGGGGGSIIVQANSVASTITLNANGGNGGNQLITNDEAEGPGGGGGGGVLSLNVGTDNATKTVTGGSNGRTSSTALTEFLANGASSGNVGSILTTSISLNYSLCADVSVLKTVSNATPLVGGQVVFTIEVTNAGPSNATSVVVNDVLPSGYTFVSANPSFGTWAAPNWNIGSLEVGETLTLTITATVNASGNYTNVATISAIESDPDASNNSSSIATSPISIADLAITKTINNAYSHIGDTVIFTIEVENFGPSNASGVIVEDLLPTGFTFVSANPTVGSWSAPEWTVGNIANGGSQSITILAIVNSIGDYENTASVSGNESDPNSSNNTSTVNLIIPIQNICGTTSVNLDSAFLVTNLPIGTRLTFHTGTPATMANKITNSTSFDATAVIYAAFEDSLANCYSPTIELNVRIINCLNPDINATFIDIEVTGDLSTNDKILVGTTYSSAPVLISSPSSSSPSIAINSNGTYSFSANIAGVYIYEVEVCSILQTSTCPKEILTIQVLDRTSFSNLPIANTDIASTLQNTAVTLNTLANDASGNIGRNLVPSSVNILTTTIPNPTTEGVLSVNSVTGAITFTPVSSFVGNINYQYEVCDDAIPTPFCAVAFQSITVLPTISANSVLAADDYKTIVGTTPTSGNVLDNDTDPEGNGLIVSARNDTVSGVGILSLNTDGSYTFTAFSGFYGPVNFIYEVCDDNLPSACAKATLYLLIEENQETNPDINASFVGKQVVGNVATNDRVLAGTTYSSAVVLINSPSGSTPNIILNNNGSYSFTGDMVGLYVYEVEVCEPLQVSACKTERLTITVVEEFATQGVPVANTDIANTLQNTPVVISTLGNDNGTRTAGNILIDLNPTSVQVISTTLPNPTTEGTLTVNPTTGEITFVPVATFIGSIGYQYEICDLDSPTPNCAIGNQVVTVFGSGSGNRVIASDDFASGIGGSTISGTLVNNDLSIGGNNLSVTPELITVTGVGELTINANGTYSFVPFAGFTGPVNFTYQVCDDATPSACAYATLYLLVYEFNPLAVELKDFEVRCFDNKIDVAWSTSKEVNHSHFDIETSKDGLNWDRIGRVAGNGNSETTNTYSIRVEADIIERRYYRLNSVDFEGIGSYSKILTLVCGGNNRNINIQLQPNPTKGLFEIVCTNNINVYKIIDSKGKLIQFGKIDQPIAAFDVSNLSPGIYYFLTDYKPLKFVKY